MTRKLWPLLLLLAPFATADGLNEEWVESDRAVARRVAPLLAERQVATWLEKAKPYDTREDRDIGFGARRHYLALYGGYATAWVSVLAVGDRVAALQVEYGDVEEAVAKRIRKACPDLDAKLHYRFRDPKLLARHRAAIKKELGPAGRPKVPADLRPAFDLLSDPLARYDFGTVCYEGGDPPAGRRALDRLVAARRLDLVRALLRSPHPEARVYAASALPGAVATRADTAAIEVISRLRIPISCCSGCSVFDQTAARALGRE